MTIGPAPMIRIEEMSVRFGIQMVLLSFAAGSGSGHGATNPAASPTMLAGIKKGRAAARP